MLFDITIHYMQRNTKKLKTKITRKIHKPPIKAHPTYTSTLLKSILSDRLCTTIQIIGTMI